MSGARDAISNLKTTIEQEEADDEATYYRMLYTSGNATSDWLDKQSQCFQIRAAADNFCNTHSQLAGQYASFFEVAENNTRARNQELAVVAKLETAVAKLENIGTEDSAADQFLTLLQDDEDVKSSTLVDIVETLFRSSDESNNIKQFLVELKAEINTEQADEDEALALLLADRNDYDTRCQDESAAHVTCVGIEGDLSTAEIIARQALQNHNNTWQGMIPVRIEEKQLLDMILDKLAEIEAIRNLEFGDIDLQTERATNMTRKIKKVLNDLITEIEGDSTRQEGQRDAAITAYNTAKTRYDNAVAARGAAQTVVDGVNQDILTKNNEITKYRDYHERRDTMRSKESQLIDRLEEFAQKLSADETAEARRQMLAALADDAEAIPVEQQEALAGAIGELRFQIAQEEAAEELQLDTLEAQLLCLQVGQNSGDLWTCTNPALHLEYAEGELADAQNEESDANTDMLNKQRTKFDWINLFLFEEEQRRQEKAGLEECIELVNQMEAKDADPTQDVGETNAYNAGRRQLQATVDSEALLFANRSTSAKVFNMLNALKESIQQEQRDDDDFVARANFTKITEEANEYDARIEKSRRANEAARTLGVKNDAIGAEASKLQALTEGNRTRELERLDIEGMKVVVANLNSVENVTTTALAEVDDLEPEEFATMLTELETEQSRAYSASEVIMNVLDGVIAQREREMLAQVAEWRLAQEWTSIKTAEDDLAQAAWGAATAAWNAQVNVMNTKRSEFQSAVANNEELTPQRAHEIILIDAMITKIKEFQAKRGLEDLEKRSKGSQKIRKFLEDMKDFLVSEDEAQLYAIEAATAIRDDASNTRGLAENALATATAEHQTATEIHATKTSNQETAQAEWDLGQETRANETAAVLEIRDLLKTLHFDSVAPGQTQTIELIGDEAETITQNGDKGRGVYIAGSYSLQFKLTLDGTTNPEWANVLMYGDDAEEERAPAIFVVPSTLRLAFQHNSADNAQSGVEPATPLVAGTEQPIKLKVTENDGSADANTMKVYYGDDIQGSVTVSSWNFYDHKKLWVSDPWHPAASGTIRNLKLTQGRPMETASLQLRNGKRPSPQMLLQMGGKRVSRTHKVSYNTHPLFGPILMQIRNKARPGAEKKIHAALDSFMDKLEAERVVQRDNLDVAISECNTAGANKLQASGTKATREMEKALADAAVAAALADLEEKTAVFNEDDPIRDEEMEVLDEILMILDRFEGIGNNGRGNVEAVGENADVDDAGR